MNNWDVAEIRKQIAEDVEKTLAARRLIQLQKKAQRKARAKLPRHYQTIMNPDSTPQATSHAMGVVTSTPGAGGNEKVLELLAKRQDSKQKNRLALQQARDEQAKEDIKEMEKKRNANLERMKVEHEDLTHKEDEEYNELVTLAKVMYGTQIPSSQAVVTPGPTPHRNPAPVRGHTQGGLLSTVTEEDNTGLSVGTGTKPTKLAIAFGILKDGKLIGPPEMIGNVMNLDAVKAVELIADCIIILYNDGKVKPFSYTPSGWVTGHYKPEATPHKKTSKSYGLSDAVYHKIETNGESLLAAFTKDGDVHWYEYRGNAKFLFKGIVKMNCAEIAIGLDNITMVEGQPFDYSFRHISINDQLVPAWKTGHGNATDMGILYPMVKGTSRAKVKVSRCDIPYAAAFNVNGGGRAYQLAAGRGHDSDEKMRSLGKFNDGVVQQVVATQKIRYLLQSDGVLLYRNEMDKQYYPVFGYALQSPNSGNGSPFTVEVAAGGSSVVCITDELKIIHISEPEDPQTKSKSEFHFLRASHDISECTSIVSAKVSKSAVCIVMEVDDKDTDDDNTAATQTRIPGDQKNREEKKRLKQVRRTIFVDNSDDEDDGDDDGSDSD
jgi:hypothetical protein